MDVLELAPGLWRWTAYHEEWKENVGSVYCETDDGVVLVDPLVPAHEPEKLWNALDRDVERAGGAVHVLVTVFWHTRSASRMIERYSARVWCVARGRGAIERRAGTISDTFGPGDTLPGGIVGLRTARATEVVYWIPQHRALVPGDVLLGDGAGSKKAGPKGLRMCPASWLPENRTPADLAESLRPLLDLPVERVLVSHGAPVLADGRAALAGALAVE